MEGNRMMCNCGKRPILKRKAFWPYLELNYIYECNCGERGINSKTKRGAEYGWKRRKKLRELIQFRLGRNNG